MPLKIETIYLRRIGEMSQTNETLKHSAAAGRRPNVRVKTIAFVGLMGGIECHIDAAQVSDSVHAAVHVF